LSTSACAGMYAILVRYISVTSFYMFEILGKQTYSVPAQGLSMNQFMNQLIHLLSTLYQPKVYS